MRRKEDSTVSRGAMRFIRRVAGVTLAGLIALSGTGIVEAAKLADVFDAEQYAGKYADLQAAFGSDAKALLKHYMTYGIAEERESGGLVDVVRYRQAYADLDAAFGDNWDAYVEHYITYGAYEGRDNFTDFSPYDYMERYPDLKEAFGFDVLALYRHYQIYGKYEGRDASKRHVISYIPYIPPREGRYDMGDGIYSQFHYDEAGNLVYETYEQGYLTSVFVVNPDNKKAIRATVYYYYFYDDGDEPWYNGRTEYTYCLSGNAIGKVETAIEFDSYDDKTVTYKYAYHNNGKLKTATRTFDSGTSNDRQKDKTTYDENAEYTAYDGEKYPMPIWYEEWWYGITDGGETYTCREDKYDYIDEDTKRIRLSIYYDTNGDILKDADNVSKEYDYDSGKGWKYEQRNGSWDWYEYDLDEDGEMTGGGTLSNDQHPRSANANSAKSVNSISGESLAASVIELPAAPDADSGEEPESSGGENPDAPDADSDVDADSNSKEEDEE